MEVIILETVQDWNQIETNLLKLDEYKKSAKSKEYYSGLIQRGKNFVVFSDNGKLLFGPSRFVGYIDNSIASHENNGDKDGGVTDKAIIKLLGTPVNSEWLEEEYLKFCKLLGIKTYNKKRVYWYKENNSTGSLISDIENIINDKSIEKTERVSLIQSRIGQGIYRKKLIDLWQGCSVTSYGKIEMLRASHIKPWSVSNNNERLDNIMDYY
jgi:putative restriction endonuclease